MYGVANEKINEGLSPFVRWFLAIIAGLFGVGMFIMAPSSSAPFGFIVFGMFCVFIALACITRGRVRQFLGSTIGLVLFIAALFYIYDQSTAGPIVSGARSEPSLLNSLFFMIAFGLPGIAYAIKAKFGFGSKIEK